MPIRFQTSIFFAFCVCFMLIFSGCSTQQKDSDTPVSSIQTREQHIIALIDGQPITRDQLQHDLYERAGKIALSELILDIQVRHELERAGISLSDADLESEIENFMNAFSSTDDKSQQYRQLEAIRLTRGLGPTRYPSFVRRNASLRKLVGDLQPPTQSELDLAQRIAFGERFRVRMFVSTDLQAVESLRDRVRAAEKHAQRWIFADACSIDSIHPSKERGGLIADLSPYDPAYPDAITNYLQKRVDETSELGSDKQLDLLSESLKTDAGYTVLFVEHAIPSSQATQQQLMSIHDRLTLRKQRVEMDRLAQELITKAQITVMDRSLNWAWKK